MHTVGTQAFRYIRILDGCIWSTASKQAKHRKQSTASKSQQPSKSTKQSTPRHSKVKHSKQSTASKASEQASTAQKAKHSTAQQAKN